MGKASKWFRNFFGLKKPDPNPSDPSFRSTSSLPTKRRWGFVRSNRDKDTLKPVAEHSNCHQNALMSPYQGRCGGDPEEHAVAVAAATAAVAEAAVAAAKAAAAVVRLTSSSGRCTHNPVPHVGRDVGKDRVSIVGTNEGGGDGGTIDNGGAVGYEELAAIKIQSTFRGYLARRALRALKGLVRLQAIVRGHIERKRTAEYLRRMQSLIRAQTCARARRILHSESLSHTHSKSSQSQNPSPQTPEKSEHPIRSRSLKNDEQSPMLKRNGSKANGKFMYDNEKHRADEWSWDQRIPSCRILSLQQNENYDKILEIDYGKHHFNPKFRNFFHSSHLLLDPEHHSYSFGTSQDSITLLTMPLSPSSAEVQSLTPKLFINETPFCGLDSSPNPVTPAMSDGSRSCQTGYSDNPSYMSLTESSKAKVRSFSAPRQRPQYERSGSAKRYHLYGLLGESRSSSMKVSGLNADFTGKAYPGSGRLDRFGMPLGI